MWKIIILSSAVELKKIIILTKDNYLLLGCVIQSWVKKSKVSVKSGFKSESFQIIFSTILLVFKVKIGWPKNYIEIIRQMIFKQRNKETRVGI